MVLLYFLSNKCTLGEYKRLTQKHKKKIKNFLNSYFYWRKNRVTHYIAATHPTEQKNNNKKYNNE